MASTYVNNLRLDEMGTGDASGTWGNTTNTNLELIGEALGFGTEAITTNADTHTTTVADGASDAGRAMYLKYTGTLDSTCTITIAPNTMKRVHIIENGTSGSQSIVISQGSGANVTIPTGQTKAVYLDGAGSGAAVVDAFTNLNLGGTTVVDDLTISDDLTVTDDLIVNGDIDLEGSIDVNGTMEADAITIGGTAIASVLSPVAGSSSIVTTGALNAGSITSGFGTIDTGSSTITTTGAITGGSAVLNGGVAIDNITIDGTEIDSSSGDLTLDVAGDIILDAGGDEVIFKDGATNVGHVSMDSDNLTIKSLVSDKDMIFQGNDGGSGITALTLDMSGAGAATFNNDVTAFSDKRLKTDIQPIADALSKVMQMQGVYYKRNDVQNPKEQVGVLAQDMEVVLPQVVLTADDEMETKSVDYGKLSAILIEAVKQLSNELTHLKQQINNGA